MIISHRGKDNHKYKENSISAIIESLSKDYIDGVEFDIRITKDKELVINHGFIYNGKIIKYSNLKDLKIDTLKNLLKRINTNKIILIEIKDNDIEIIDILYKIIKRVKLNILIHSFHEKILIDFKKKYPKYKIGIISFNNNLCLDKFDFISLYYSNYKKQSKPVFLWTVNNKNKLLEFNHKGLSIITDNAYKLNNL